jgi:predicted amidohydrolase
MKAGYLQFKPVFGEPDKNISRIAGLISGNDFDLLVIPELANSGYLFSSKDELHELAELIPGKFCNFLQQVCSDRNCYIVSGICENISKKFYNSAILVHPDGHIDTYRKIHLFNEEKLWFSPGDRPPEVYTIGRNSFRHPEVHIGMMVCFDWRFPETARTLALKGAQIICHPSNLVMPHCQDAMVIRALENQVFTITANRIGKDVKQGKELAFTGKSIICNPKGDVMYIGSEDREECYIAEIDPALALDKVVTKYNNVFDDRREDLYYK